MLIIVLLNELDLRHITFGGHKSPMMMLQLLYLFQEIWDLSLPHLLHSWLRDYELLTALLGAASLVLFLDLGLVHLDLDLKRCILRHP